MTRRDFGAFLIIGAMTLKGKWADGEVKTQVSASSKHHIRNRRLFNFAAGSTVLAEWERQHLHECEVCQEMAYVLIRQLVASRT
jgi:hypothetical protein